MKSADMCVCGGGGEAYPKKAPLKRKPPPIRIGARKKIVRTKECKLKKRSPPPPNVKKGPYKENNAPRLPTWIFLDFLGVQRIPLPSPPCVRPYLCPHAERVSYTFIIVLHINTIAYGSGFT